MKRIVWAIPLMVLAERTIAHCPLCTVGAAAAAGGAVYLGVSKVVVGLFIGAFAASTGFWMEKKLPKRYIPYQKTVIVLAALLLTLLPILPVITKNYPLYLSGIGSYGRTYVVNVPLLTGLLGGVLVSLTPSCSRKITLWRQGKTVPFQGVILTLILLLLTGGALQMMVG